MTLLNQRAMAEACNVAPRNFSAWRVPVAETQGRQKLYAISDVIDNRVAHATRRLEQKVERLEARVAELQTAEDGKSHAEVLLEQHAARTRLLREQGDAQEMKNEIARHDVAPFGFFTFVLAQMANEIAGVLDGLPAAALRKGKLDPRQADALRTLASSTGEQIARLGDEAWVTGQFNNYLEEINR